MFQSRSWGTTRRGFCRTKRWRLCTLRDRRVNGSINAPKGCLAVEVLQVAPGTTVEYPADRVSPRSAHDRSDVTHSHSLAASKYCLGELIELRQDPCRSAFVLRVLIVDDEAIARRVLRDELDSIGDIAIIGEAETGLAAVNLIQRLTPDLVFLDLQMPELGGIEVLRTLSARRSLPVIVVSACESCSRNAVNAGAAGYLLKPVAPTSLRGVIDGIRSSTITCSPEIGHRETPFPASSDCCRH